MTLRTWMDIIETTSPTVAIKPSSDDLGEVSSANSTYGFVGKNGMAKTADLNGGPDFSDPNERRRVDALKQAISSPQGYFSRIIIDGLGNVVEGQHRFAAASELGWDEIPVSQIIDASDHVEPKIVQDVMAAGGLNESRAWQVVCNVVENVYEDDDLDGDYNHMGGWAKAFNAALHGIQRMGGLKDLLRIS